ncbi:MAG: DSBA oxidoreductase [Candidatus Magasanikbacteria bacterium GW2011_GWC2_34_16]|uniref:DSBA oxidoreductase n=2 Tax=Candidatus Magasanikiibacteriota TaxID=1752731 RepID=A0A0G0HRJ0_9BACT|nr:MAG: DSBA oxidoreductase [Candidatus Magasanikbacteria bacterium GW2011_GWC2_34_16]KKQ41220.1 MAG: DSBA oxidoreductase [Candidatus Magasanikbacteria bacterium GW2011_GWA2_37_8]
MSLRQTWWGVTLLSLGGVLVVAIVIFLAVVGRYWWEIKQGRGDILAQKIYSGFTASTSTNNNVSADRVILERTDAPYLGNADAEVVIVEFVDFKCPNCLAEAPIIKNLVQKYGNKLKLIIRNFPVESLHPGATQLATIAECAYEEGLYWPTHDYLYNRQSELPATLSDEEIKNVIAPALNLDAVRLKACLANRNTTVRVNRDYADGLQFGVRGTPTFFVNGEKIEGVIPLEVWDQFFSKL